ncbi:MAG: hypothetical protein HY904_23930 [Deltaproteobacteria bacterium]|nr:hypothetical protein [Deltaproteobacteria bacterium]
MAWVPPKSLQYKPEEIPAAVQARVHLQRADEVKQPHFRYLELWKGFEAMYREEDKSSNKLLANRQGGRAAGELDLIAALLTSLSRPRAEQLLAHAELPNLLGALARKNLKRLIGENDLMRDLGMTEGEFHHAKKDLQFNLKANYWKATEALARLLFVVRAACDPTVRKTDNLVSDEPTLKSATEILKFALRTLTDQMGEEQGTFMGVGKRTEVAEGERKRALQRGRKA